MELGCEALRVSRGARKAVEVVPESEVDGMRGKLEVEEAARPVVVPYPFNLIFGDLVLVLVVLEVSTRVSVSSWSRSRSVSWFEFDLDIVGTSGESIGLAEAVAVAPEVVASGE